jgi:hypothetical protein
MTLTDISRLLKIAKVPRSKVIECFYPNPCVIVHVDATYMPVLKAVIERVRLVGQTINVTLLDSQDVRPNEHLYIKVKGQTEWRHDPQRSKMSNQMARRVHHAQVVIDCYSVIAQ